MPYAKSKTLKPYKQHDNRDILSKNVGKPDYFTGTFVKFGYDVAHHERKVLATGIVNSVGQLVTRHLWLPLTEEIKLLNLNFGDKFEFQGTPIRYEKGRIEYDLIYESFTISNPTNVSKIGKAYF